MLAALVRPLVVAFLCAAAAHAQTVTTAVPGFLAYQGKVSNANGTLVGAGTPVNRTVIFRIWGHQSNSTVNDLIYSEQQTVTISEGEFSALIGQGTAVSGTPLGYSEAAKGPTSNTIASPAVFGGATRYLGITIDDPATSADPEVSPRQQLVTSAYAFRAKYAESLGSNGVNTLNTLDNGNVGIGTSNPGAKLEVAGNIRAGGAATPTASLALLANSATTQAMSIGYSSSIGTYSSDAAAGDTVMRTENGGKLLLQNGTGSSALTISGGLVGVANSSPTALLNVGSGVNRGETGLLVNTGWFNSADPTEGRPLDVRRSNVSHLVVNTDGNVGVGVNTPGKAATPWAKARLAVDGNILLKGEGGGGVWTNQRLLFGGDGSGYTLSIASVNNAGVVNPAAMTVFDSGRVGIGTSNPLATLDVRNTDAAVAITVGDTGGSNGALFFGNSNHGARRNFGGWSNDVGLFTTGGSVVLSAQGNYSTTATIPQFILRQSGNVGIGTADPANGKLVVNGSASENVGAHAWFSQGTGINQATNFNATDVSIKASGAVNASQYRALSDARIKRVVGRSNASADLALLNQIEITDYTYIDTVAKGAGENKKLIGQQVESVFPQAVKRGTDVIPDIYAKATAKDGWIELMTDLKVGERVRVIADKVDAIYEVLEVQSGRFRSTYTGSPEELFVYGREVKDFRTVDYEAVAMLNVSATQEISREVTALRAANVELTQRLAQLEAKDRARDAKLAAIEKLISSGQAVMARPNGAPTSNASGQE